MSDQEEGQKRILVLCVDRDDDLGVKAGIRTPLKGRDENLNAAVALALRDPEEPDANAMFEAVRVYDRMQDENKPDEIFEIATISGSELGGVGADRKVVSQLEETLASFPTSEVILVTDGYSDETVLPLVESRVPVSSVRRVVVKHSESIEETAALLGRYLRTVWENPRYSKILLGLPGLLLVLIGVLSLFGSQALAYFGVASALVIGVTFLVKGFGVDRLFKGLVAWIREYSPPPLRVQISAFSAVVGVLCLGVGVYLGLIAVSSFLGGSLLPGDIAGWLGLLPQIAGFFISAAVDLMIVGICVVLLGKTIRYYFERDVRLLRNAVLIVLVGWSDRILAETSEVLKAPGGGNEALVSIYIIIGVLLGVASALTILIVYRSTRRFFTGTREKLEES